MGGGLAGGSPSPSRESGGGVISYDDLVAEGPDLEPPVPIRPTSLQRQWLKEGVVVLRRFLPDRLIAAYCEAHRRQGLGIDWRDATPYMRILELRDLCCHWPLADVLEELIGEPCGVHLNLAGWVSTERDWHQDHYLNPPHVGSFYVAVWFALDDIHPDSGPFEWIPRSHLWPLLSAEKIRALIPEERRELPSWPYDSEAVLTPAVERKTAELGVKTKRFLGKKGDVLIWHARLLHRGSPPKVKGMTRRGLIAHYSGIHHRQDMPPAIKDEAGGWYFPL
jgi:hypothetical protein